MTKPAPIDEKKLMKLLEKLGYVNKGQKGTYKIFQRPGNVKNLMIRQSSELTPALLNEILTKVSDQTDIPIINLKRMMEDPTLDINSFESEQNA
jgi:predicted RNA binding protein YcfA (HicA-like mRNA interferase family)